MCRSSTLAVTRHVSPLAESFPIPSQTVSSFRVFRRDEACVRRSVMLSVALLLFGLLGATYVVYTALVYHGINSFFLSLLLAVDGHMPYIHYTALLT